MLLIGHGSFDGTEAKFNLVGPDLSSVEWARAAEADPRPRSWSSTRRRRAFPFLEHLAGPRRVVITATDSVAQRFDTVFPEYFIRALTDSAPTSTRTAASRCGRRSPPRASAFAATTRSAASSPPSARCIDDDGDGVGREAGGDGKDGSASSRLYLDPDVPGAAPTDEELLRLLQKRAALQIDADELKQRRQLMTPEEYQQEFERLMLALARVSRDLRRRQGSS